MSLAAVLALGTAGAPAAMATPTGCGDLDNGQLCVNKPPRAAGDFEVSYHRHAGDGTVTVQLGIQFKNPEGTVHPADWLGTRTIRAGATGKASRYYTTDAGWCVQGLMKSGNTTYLTKWLCYWPP